ncbi:MAG TPA: fluoride efflux transporter CrcB [Myxococcota bacterium]|jgi:CrcB protein|nr:fluoride efflux transporter CrcB [Myxococcota bacterium]
MVWILLFLGGGLGTLARFVLATVVQVRADSDFPFGTLVVNLSGCLVMGLLAAIFAARPTGLPAVERAVLTGFLGGYTTFSAFGLESMRLFEAGEPGLAFSYVAASVVLGPGATALGLVAGRLVAA